MKTRPELARVSLLGDRKINQDRCLTLREGEDTLLAVADGLGGHPRGETAAQLMMDTCEHLFRSIDHPVAKPQAFLKSCLEHAHNAIVRFGMSQEPNIAPRTTGVVCLVQNSRAWWSHVGDSRLYLYRDGNLMERTHDHSRKRQIERRGKGGSKVTITRCLGGLNPPPEITESGPVGLHPGDTLLLSSDGFWSQFDTADLGRHLYQGGELGENLTALAERACRNAQPRSDNATAVAMRWWPRDD
jgi:serine/threonine protein phosphatase PrpC